MAVVAKSDSVLWEDNLATVTGVRISAKKRFETSQIGDANKLVAVALTARGGPQVAVLVPSASCKLRHLLKIRDRAHPA